MKNIILTSAGFDNKKIRDKFLELVNVPNEKIKVVFIPTAAITERQKSIIPLCKNDLLNAGILENNIFTYNLDSIIDVEEICEFDAIYVCGGSIQYLLNKMIEVKFHIPLEKFLNNGGVYVGVSAGSIVLAKNTSDSLGYLNCKLSVHEKDGAECGYLDTSTCSNIKLTDNQAIIVVDNQVSIIE